MRVQTILFLNDLCFFLGSHEEAYEAFVRDASLRKFPNQNGSNRKRFTDFVHWDQKSELQLRASDRRIFSRTYSKFDENFWKTSIGDDLREWYTIPPRSRSEMKSADFDEGPRTPPRTGYLALPSESSSPNRFNSKLPFLAPVFAPKSDCFPHQQPTATFVAIGKKTLLKNH